ncbi:myosin heavy chain, non-muscle-like [Artemia franciscana]|uniref:myosin heavy chain, non-muscle-like n=1 Tax=Artemia franciscana TaxID=6661 RepID=UPI0032DB2B48
MEEKVSDLSQVLAEEEEKSKHLAELKEKHETSLSDLEERLNKEQIALQESNKEFEALKATTAAEQELRTKREQELALLKKSLEEESGHHESQLMEMRHKHSQELAVLQEQMDNAKKIMEALEKAKATLAAENADMANEIKSIATSKAETDRKRKHLESQVIELEKTQRNFDKILAEEKAISERFASERDAAERDARKKETKVLSLSRDLEEYIVKVEELERSRRVLQNELDEFANSQGTADKNVSELTSHFQECERARSEVEDAKEEKRNFERQIAALTVQLHEAKKHADNEAEALLQLEELRKRSSKDIESLQRQIEELKVQLHEAKKHADKEAEALLQLEELRKKASNLHCILSGSCI